MIIILNYKTYFTKISPYRKSIKAFDKNVWHAVNPYFYLHLKKEFPRKIIGLQNLSFRIDKPLTGEISPEFELVSKANFVLLGHSERFKVGENLEIVKKKIESLQNMPLNLVIFFSELSYRPKEKFNEVKKETEKVLNNYIQTISEENFSKIIFVYEPWWAISTEGGKIPSREFLQEFLDWFRSKYTTRVFYGGSFNSQLALEYKGLDFDGFVLGKASTSIKEIKTIIKILKNWT
jgi:triosephosphate isomerase (TIM)